MAWSPSQVMTEPTEPVRPEAGRRLTSLYVLALSTVAVLSIGAQALIQRQLTNGESDSRVINVAGRQRMLSQRLAKAALRFGLDASDDKASVKSELAATLTDWSDSHQALQRGDPSLGLPGSPSQEVQKLFAEIEPHFGAMHAAAATLIDHASEPAAIKSCIELINRNEAAFLSGMDRLVSQYVVEAEQRINRLRRLELMILIGTLTVLLLEGLFIFRPAVRRITQTVGRLESLSNWLSVAKSDAESASEAKSRFIANVSHELRTPMTAVLGMTELARNAESDHERKKFLDIVDEAGKSLLGLLNDLINFARIDADRIVVRQEPMVATDPVDRVMRVFTPSAQSKGIRLKLEIPEDSAPVVLADEERIVQVLSNLVSNAIKWTDTGEVTVAVDWQQPESNRVFATYRVSDTGVGISDEDQDRVFDDFVQVDQPGGATRGGVGLGLAITRRLVEAMNGSIGLQSQAGAGTTFEVRLDWECALQPEKTERNDHQLAGRSLKVLVVEDNEVNRIFLDHTLRGGGHTVAMASSGELGLAEAKERDFDVILIDLGLPDMAGDEVAAKLRANVLQEGRDLPALVCLTAHADPDSQAAASGVFDAFLTKPIRTDELLLQLARLTGDDLQAAPPTMSSQSLATELADAFLAVVDSQLEELVNASKARDLRAVRVVSHRLAGQLANFEAPQALLLARKLEEAAEAGHHDQATELVGELLEATKSLTLELERSQASASTNRVK